MIEELFRDFLEASIWMKAFIIFAGLMIWQTTLIGMGISTTPNMSEKDEQAINDAAGCMLSPIYIIMLLVAVANKKTEDALTLGKNKKDLDDYIP